MAKDRTNSEQDAPPPDETSAQQSDGDSDDKEASDTDPQTARAARLAAIKAAVDAGKYDSDEMLEIALNKMIQRLPIDHDE